MAGLTSKTIVATYKGLLKTAGDNIAIPSGSTGVNIVDGEENTTALWLSNTHVGIGINQPSSMFHVKGTGAYLILENSSTEDSDGGRETRLDFKGRQSGDEASTLARIEASHDGSSDDQKGDLRFYTNDGSDDNSPTERMRIDSVGNVGIGTTAPGNLLAASETTAGTSGGIAIGHTDNSNAASDAGYWATVGGASGGDPYLNFTISGVTDWRIGIDNSDTDKFKIANANSLNSTPRLTIDASGNVGIGTTAPGNTLEVNGGTATGVLISSDGVGANNSYIQFKTDADGTPRYGMIGYDYSDSLIKMITGSSFDGVVTGLVVNTSGNVGIGDVSPTNLLSVKETTAGTSGGIAISHTDTDNAASDAGYWATVGGANGGDPYVNFTISGVTDWRIGIDNTDDSFKISNSNSLEGTPRLTIDASGYVGIGTASPAFGLDVQSGNIGKGQLRLVETGNNANCGIQLWASNGAAADDGWKIAATHSGAGLHIQSSKTAGMGGSYAWDDVMTLLPSGNVGIGTDAPVAELSVVGRVSIGNGAELTVSSAAITVTQSYHNVDTESDASSDTLTTINGGQIGAILVLRANNSARTVSLAEGGNILLTGGMDLDHAADTITLIYDGSNWLEIARANNA